MEARKAGRPQPKRWHPVISFWSLASGLSLGLGMAVLLQQYSVQVLTLGALVRTVVVAFVVAVALPSAAYAVGVRRYNAALRKAGLG